MSWRPDGGDRRDVRHDAYEISVFGDGDAPVWTSGRVASDQSVDVPYGGPVASRARYGWRVRVLEKSATDPGPWSEPSWWEMGLLHPVDWQGQWISGPDRDAVPDVEGIFRRFPASIFRTRFSIDAPPETARAYESALGLYELSINGERVGAQVLAPGWTDYHRRVQYQTYDVTGLMAEGPNAVAVLLGDGWYSGNIATLVPSDTGTHRRSSSRSKPPARTPERPWLRPTPGGGPSPVPSPPTTS